MQWTGAPKIGVRYKSSSNSFVQFNYQIYEVQPDGSSRFITRANFTDRSYVKNSKVNKTFYGQGHSHIFKAGNKIRVLITNLDTAPTDSVFLGTNPFVLPITVNSNHSIILNSNSYIEFPVIISAFSSVGDILHEEQNSQPFAYELKQNYPNPFNPATTIEYSIAKAGNVEIKVYDMLGREVKSLVNEYRDAGFHKIFFNASELSSGVYFYKISTTEFSEVKRMVLIK
jgi:predicted acyl esterase